MKTTLYFPGDIIVHLNKGSEPTDDFRKQIRKAFYFYTVATPKAYRDDDKMEFINLIREMNFPVEPHAMVNDFLRDEIDEDGNLSLADIGLEAIEYLVENAIGSARREWDRWTNEKHLNRAACHFFAAAIKEVMNFEEKESDANDYGPF